MSDKLDLPSPARIKQESHEMLERAAAANSGDSTVMGPPAQLPLRFDERTIKRETYEKTKRLERQASLYTRPRPWICRTCQYDMYPDPQKHYHSHKHLMVESANLIDLLPRNCKEVVITVGKRLILSSVKSDLQSYGPIVKIQADVPCKGCFVVLFADSRSISAIKARKSFYVCGVVAKIRPARPTIGLNSADIYEQNRNIRIKAYHHELMDIIEYEGRFLRQVFLLAYALQPSEEECLNVKYVFEDVASKHFNSILMVSGLEISGCVIQIAVQHQGKVGSQEMNNFLDKATDLLQPLAKNLHCDKSIPEFKFTHKVTGFIVRMTINDFISVQRNILLNTFLKLHFGVKLMASYVQYWALLHKLSDKQGFSPLSLIVMVVYYLQQLPVPVIPSVQTLQEGVSPLLINGWNCAIQKDKAKIPQTVNKYSLRQLISGFFAFYSKFNFHAFVLCPYIGQHLRKSLFQNIHELPDSFKAYKQKYLRNNSVVKANRDEVCDPLKMCVLDLFDLGINLTSTISPEKMEVFQMTCEHTRSIFDSESMSLLKILAKSLDPIPIKYFEGYKRRNQDASNEVVFLKEEKKPPIFINLSDEESDDDTIVPTHQSEETSSRPSSGYRASISSVESSMFAYDEDTWDSTSRNANRTESTLEADDENDWDMEMNEEEEDYAMVVSDHGGGESDAEMRSEEEPSYRPLKRFMNPLLAAGNSTNVANSLDDQGKWLSMKDIRGDSENFPPNDAARDDNFDSRVKRGRSVDADPEMYEPKKAKNS